MTQATMDSRNIRQTLLTTPAPGTVSGTGFSPVEVAITPQTTSGFLSRSHVLQAAAACFDELGYDRLTIRAIAARLGCSVGSIYRYFTDKRELLLACSAQVLEPVADALENDHATFDASVALYIRQASTMSEQYRLMFWLCADLRNPRQLPVLSRILDAWAALLGDPAQARARWARLHGLLIIGEDAARIESSVTSTIASPRPVREPDPTLIAREAPEAEPADADDVTLL